MEALTTNLSHIKLSVKNLFHRLDCCSNVDILINDLIIVNILTIQLYEYKEDNEYEKERKYDLLAKTDYLRKEISKKCINMLKLKL